MSAQKLLSGPEDHVGELKTLLAMATNQDMQVCGGEKPSRGKVEVYGCWGSDLCAECLAPNAKQFNQ